MGKISLLTKNQKAFLSLLKENNYFTDRFYFTGGTVLAEYYLRHRYSDDLDFFSETEFDQQVILGIMEKISRQLKFTFTSRFIEVVYRFQCEFPNGGILKVDFAYYPYKRLAPSINKDGLYIDSQFDIAVNKTNTLSQRQEVKDFVDCFYLWQEESFYDLVHGVERKFHEKFEPVLLSSDMLSVEYFSTLPRMIKKLKLEDLKKFFREQAKELAKASVEK